MSLNNFEGVVEKGDICKNKIIEVLMFERLVDLMFDDVFYVYYELCR